MFDKFSDSLDFGEIIIHKWDHVEKTGSIFHTCSIVLWGSSSSTKPILQLQKQSACHSRSWIIRFWKVWTNQSKSSTYPNTCKYTAAVFTWVKLENQCAIKCMWGILQCIDVENTVLILIKSVQSCITVQGFFFLHLHSIAINHIL